VIIPRLSKSKYLSGLQCPLKLWYDCYQRELASPIDLATQSIFDTGHEVGMLARDRYPGGIAIDWDHFHRKEALEATREALSNPDVPAIYEAAFEFEGVLIRADVLQRADDGWVLVEVKSSTRAKEVHQPDVAVQFRVLRGLGVNVVRAGVLTLTRDYVYDGERLDLDRLFVFHDLTELAEGMLADIDRGISEMHAMLAGTRPDIPPGPHCFAPYECGYYAHCTRDLTFPEYPLTDLPGFYSRRREELEAGGVSDVREVPEDVPLSALQAIARQCVIAGEDRVHGDLAGALAAVKYPVYHLDFETIGPAIPRYAGTRPYDIVPFQFSVHAETADGTLHHAEYLHTEVTDPREPLARALLDALGETGSICVYTSYESTVISGLAARLPGLATGLDALRERIWDLHPVIKNNYYHPEFRGSFSIKKVLPALVPDMRYEDLEISDGGMASIRYEQALRSDDRVEREGIFRALRAYCAQDTLAMVELRKVLAARAEKGDIQGL
jgi:hypothetical protein